jgi:hypothetical protein
MLNRRWLVLLPAAGGTAAAVVAAGPPVDPLTAAIGLLGGLAAGLALVVLLEYREASFTHEEEIIRVLGLPVLSVVPILRSPAQQRAHRYWRTTGNIVGWVVLMAAVALTLRGLWS